MHGTHLPLRKWFLAAYLVATHSNGISALQLQPKIGVGYKTAWLLLHKLRRAMVDPNRKPLDGFIEIDETSVIFRRKTEPEGGGQGRSHRGKMFLVGAVEVVDGVYPGRIRLERIRDTTKPTIRKFIARHTTAESHIITDGYSAYKDPLGRGHTAHNLSADDAPPAHVVLPWVHRVFSNFKRWAAGTYHGVRDKHVDIYANEFVFRWNRRRHFQTNIDTIFRLGQEVGRVTWRDIVGDTKKWRKSHEIQILAMVDPQRLKRALDYSFETGLDIFDALDDVRSEEHKHKYQRRKPKRSALPPRRLGEERVTRRYVHPPKLSPADIAGGHLRHISAESKITFSRVKSLVDDKASAAA